MAIKSFPDVSEADEYGLLALGGDLETESLLLAYRNGIFPWPIDSDGPIPWFSPDPRCILFLDELHISRKLKKLQAQDRFRFTIDSCTKKVIEACSNSKHRGDTWITTQMVEAYTQLAEEGFCHSVECWLDDNLVGGLYGVSIGSMFAGESMFFIETGASKLSLLYLVAACKDRGLTWIDCQQMTPLFRDFGAREIDRSTFLEMLRESLAQPSLF